MDLTAFVQRLRDENELVEVSEPVSTYLEITEITDRISKAPTNRNKALLFTNNGTEFPILTNALGSEKRICIALNCNSLDEHKTEIENLFQTLISPKKSFSEKLSFVPLMARLNKWFPKHAKRKGACQEIVEHEVDLNKIPILHCWKHDAGRFITLPTPTEGRSLRPT